MTPHRAKKLTLHRETLRTLSGASLGRARGGDSGSLSCTGPDCGGGGTSIEIEITKTIHLKITTIPIF